MKTHDEMVREWRQDPAFVREYDSLEQEFALFDELLHARQEAGLTQAEVAKLMATQPSVVARLEAGGGRLKHSPSLATLQKYAEAVGCRLEVKMVHVPSSRGHWHRVTRLTPRLHRAADGQHGSPSWAALVSGKRRWSEWGLTLGFS